MILFLFVVAVDVVVVVCVVDHQAGRTGRGPAYGRGEGKGGW